LGAGTGCGEFGDLGVIRRVALVGDRPGEDRRVRGHADHVARLDQLGEVAGIDTTAGEVIQPDADACCCEVCGGGAHAFSLTVARAASTTASAVMPNSWNRVL